MRIAVLLSGGVDSSVALRLLQRQQPAAEIEAFYLKIWLEDDLAFLGDCPWEEDLQYARAVCAQAGVPLRIVPLQSVYHQRVVAEVVTELRAGRTPSPDIWCNQRIKFGAFFDSIEPDFDVVATGHYARLRRLDGRVKLCRAPDPVKDQTYFLCSLSQPQLARACFPIGGYEKREVRALAAELALPNRDRKDSQGICFLGQIRYAEFVRAQLGERIGEIVDLDSRKVLGQHDGYWFYTIGQRQGLGLSGGPWYVAAKDVERNVIYVTHRRHLASHECRAFALAQVSWIDGPPAKQQLLCKLRHGPALIACDLAQTAGRWQVALATADPGVAAGQTAVFYDDDICLGGGVIATGAPPGAAVG